MESIGGPMESIGGPMESIGGPMESIGGPMESIGGPMEYIGRPVESIGGPMEFRGGPMESTGGPMGSIGGPMEYIAALLCHSSSLLSAQAGAGGQKGKADSTRRCSQAVPHPSTNRALRRLTSEVGRDPVYSTRYGRQREKGLQMGLPFGRRPPLLPARSFPRAPRA